ncbi:MAG TPA: hypothetical protein VHU23_13260 [Rhizomicrobium sp.]|jgi:hypothetical protein|nr:hypothetical protein [Rhizomicrobium sp.]
MMHPDQPQNAAAIPTTRSAVSNGSRRQLFGDQRSGGARRFRDLMLLFARELGGVGKVSITGLQTIRRLSQISVELEIFEARRASGEEIDPVAYATLSNVQARLLRTLEQEKLAREVEE